VKERYPQKWWIVGSGLVVIALAAIAIFLTVLSGALLCSGENSNCADSTAKDTVYEGILMRTPKLGATPVPYRDGEFLASFGSREHLPPVAFHTDAAGRYCILWADGDGPFFMNPSVGGGVLQDSEIFRRGNAVPKNLPREADLGVPPGCEEGSAGIPWYRAEGVQDRWQYWLLILLPCLAIVAGLLTFLSRSLRMGSYALGIGAGFLVAYFFALFVLRFAH
jgi:hypothetical protein